MKYKLICSDFDGTLLCDDFTISQKDADSVKDYVRRGGKFVILTGRMTYGMQDKAKILGTEEQPLSVCGFNGCLAIDKDGTELFGAKIDYRVAEKIIKEAEDNGLYVHTYENENVLIEKPHDVSSDYSRICGVTLREVGKLSDYVHSNQMDCVKIMIVVESCDLKKTLSRLKSMNFEGVEFVTSSENFIEAIPANGGKANALKKIAEFYGVDIDDVIAVGDHRNDIGMIAAAGLGCCVGNAIEEVKAVAKYVAPSNNENAISDIIEKYTGE